MENNTVEVLELGSDQTSDLLIPSNSVQEKNLNRTEEENIALNIDYLLNSSRMEQYLENYCGFKIPKLLIERKEVSVPNIPDDFQLPCKIHDIYEETSYHEFHLILQKMQPGEQSNPEDIVFKFDYQKVWENL